MLQIKEELECRVERREEMNSNRTFSYYVELMNIGMPVNISLWFSQQLKNIKFP